jgi:murein DD-endopeptidase MepM/ murein hydrolase activator NlpD
MVDPTPMGDLSSFNKELDKILQKLDHVATSLDNVATSGKGINTGATSSTGIGSLGLGSSGSNFLNTYFGSIPSFYTKVAKFSLGAGIAGNLLKGAGSLIGGAGAALPNLSATMGMASGEYYAAAMSGGYKGGVTWGAVGNQTMRGLAGGITSPGSIGAVSASLANSGIFAGNTRGVYGGAGQYNNALASIRGAARYLNIDNGVAAQSVANMYSGSTSMSMLQNFGIYTTNPMTGKSASPLQQFAMLNNRLTGGGQMSYNQVKTALGPGGMLTADIKSSGLDATGQTMLRKYMLDAAKGNYWSSSDYGSELAKNAGGNPSQPGMDIFTSQTKVMQTASQAYVEGVTSASKAIEQMNTVLNNFLKSPFGRKFASLNAAGETLATDPTVQGAAGGVLGAAQSALGIGSSILDFLSARKAGKSRGLWKGGFRQTPTPGGKLRKGYSWGGKKGNKIFDSAGKKLSKAAMQEAGTLDLKAIGKGIGKVALAGGGALDAVFMGASLFGDVASGQGWGTKQFSADAGSGIGGFVGGALGTLLDPVTFGMGTILGGMAGAYLGGQIGASMPSGGSGNVASGVMTSTGGKLKLIHPVGRAKIGTRYGQKDGLHPAGHGGIDFVVPLGTPVQAAADGKVTFAGGNSQNTMGTNNRTLGMQVWIDHGNGYTTVYGHLSAYNVYVGTEVKAGQQIGSSGNSGYSSGPHLHFELRYKGQHVDPSSALGGNYSAVTGGVKASSGSSATTTGDGSGSAGSAGTLGLSSGAWSGTMPAAYSGASVGTAATKVAAMGSSVLGVGGKANSGAAAVGAGAGGGADTAPMQRSGSVTINVNVQSASESEAKRMAMIIKDYLEQDKLAASMRRA